MYYNIKLSWKQPKEGSDEMQKKQKNFLIYAESIVEAEIRFSKWIPSNYQDPVTEEVKQTKIVAVSVNGASETFWIAKLVDDADGRQKPVTSFVVLNGINIEDAVKRLRADYSMSETDAIQKYKGIVDDDLISEKLPT